MSKKVELDTSIYIDGLNLYHGVLKGTSYERLDLMKFCQKILHPRNRITQIKYFTSPPLRGGERRRRYDSYIQALAEIPEVNIVSGFHKEKEVTGPNVMNPEEVVTIKVPEEKCSDVNLASHLIGDACQNKLECAVIISNDSDMLGAMKVFQAIYPNKLLGLVTPEGQWTLRSLVNEADFYIEIKSENLVGCHLS